MAKQRKPPSRYRPPKKRDPLASARRVVIAILAFAVVALAVLIISHAVKPSKRAAPTTVVPNSGQAPNGKAKVYPVPPATVLSLRKFAAATQQEPTSTFRLTYASTNVPGAPPQVSLEQLPPERLFKASGAEVLVTAKKTYYCTTAQRVACNAAASPAATPLGRVMSLYDAASYRGTFDSLQSLIRTGSVYAVSSSTKTLAGLASDCLSWRHLHSLVTYCVTANGILTDFTIAAAGSTPTFAIQLKSYSGKVAQSDFAIPKVATPLPAKHPKRT